RSRASPSGAFGPRASPRSGILQPGGSPPGSAPPGSAPPGSTPPRGSRRLGGKGLPKVDAQDELEEVDAEQVGQDEAAVVADQPVVHLDQDRAPGAVDVLGVAGAEGATERAERAKHVTTGGVA